jgi:hypothetical protein
MAAHAFGLGAPLSAHTSPGFQSGFSTYGNGGINPFAFSQPFGSSPYSLTQSSVLNPYATLPLQQIQQLLQIVPQQLQHLLQASYLQQHQLQQLQQILQFIPAQLAQLHQLIQYAQNPIQQPFATAGVPPMSMSSAWGAPALGGQPGYVM